MIASKLGVLDDSRLTIGSYMSILDINSLFVMKLIDTSKEGSRCYIAVGRNNITSIENSQPLTMEILTVGCRLKVE